MAMFIPDILIAKNHPAEKLARMMWQAHQQARAAVRQALIDAGSGEMTKVAAITAADTIYGIDMVAEAALLNFLDARHPELGGAAFLLVGEFETGEAISFGHGEPQFRVLLDPIDGTRLLMHKKSSGWILTGIAPERGEATRLADIFFALQTELPPPKQTFGDTLWASQFSHANGGRENLLTGDSAPLILGGVAAADLRHGFISFVNLFPRGKQLIAKLEEEFLYSPAVLAPPPSNAPIPVDFPIFEDQHLSTGGQLYALMTGQMRLVVDFRPLLNHLWRRRNEPTLLCAHPYDIATALIAQKAGVSLFDHNGADLNGPTEPTAEIGWIGFCNQQLAARYLPTILEIIERNNLHTQK
jgi:hypothetical protein